jgi:hypothetical protein
MWSVVKEKSHAMRAQYNTIPIHVNFLLIFLCKVIDEKRAFWHGIYG